MTGKRTVITLCILALGLSGCAVSTPTQAVPASTPSVLPAPVDTASLLPSLAGGSIAFPKIDRRPAPVDMAYGAKHSLPEYDPASGDDWQVDLRGWDISKIDLRGSLDDLLYADFDSRTVWPDAENLPAGFDPQLIMDMGKNPGLRVRTLHGLGITGRGVGIAIVDQPLIVDHVEYADRLQLYEEVDVYLGTESTMHGLAVASIAAGKTVGVAPEADLYYIGSRTSDWDPTAGELVLNFNYYAKAIRRILEINDELPGGRKIRVIALQIGWMPGDDGYKDITAAVDEAKAAGLLVVSSSLQETFGFKFHALGREPRADPDAFESYEPGLWWAKDFYQGRNVSDRLLVPMDSRTTASPGGKDEYVFYRMGGWSWSIPYIAGMYALAAQVDPGITPGEFWSAAMKTGRTIQLNHEGKDYSFGPILDPVGLIAALQAAHAP